MLEHKRYSTLIVSAGEKFTSALTGVLDEENFYPVVVLKSISAARRELLEREYDIIAINAPLPDELGANFAIDRARDSSAGVVLFVPGDIYDEISDKAADFGVMTVAKPTSRAVVRQTLKLLCATRQRVLHVEQKAASFEEKIEEIKLVNKAKWLLVDKLVIDEPRAHRYIEKLAMDTRRTKIQVARDIIEEYKDKE